MLIDDEMRKHFSEAGAEHVKKFTWEQTALKTLEVYRQVIKPQKST